MSARRAILWLALIPAIAFAGPVYRWVAPDGSIHYGETPPGPGARAMDLEVNTPTARPPGQSPQAGSGTDTPSGPARRMSISLFEGRSPTAQESGFSLRIRPAKEKGSWSRVKTTAHGHVLHFSPPRPGRYQALVVADTDGDGRANGPGDLRGLGIIDTREGKREHDLRLSRLIHLLSPVDNRFPVTALSQQCGNKAFVLPTTLPVAWKPLGEKAVFTWRVRKVRCHPFAILESVAGATTTGTTAELSLPPSGPNEGWIFELRANERGRETGRLLTLDDQGMHWHYRFRTQKVADAKPEQ
ncbi:MAG: DUF4124 domain-containing protein [Gammaproteobacteria bacterium]